MLRIFGGKNLPIMVPWCIYYFSIYPGLQYHICFFELRAEMILSGSGMVKIVFPYLCLSLYISVYMSRSLCLCLYVFVSTFLALRFCLYIYLSTCVSLRLCLFISVSTRPTLLLCLYVSVSIFYFLFLCLCLYVSDSNLCLRHCLYISVSTFLSLHLCLYSLSLGLCLLLCLYVSVSIFPTLSLRLGHYASACTSPSLRLHLYVSDSTFCLYVSVSRSLSLPGSI